MVNIGDLESPKGSQQEAGELSVWQERADTRRSDAPFQQWPHCEAQSIGEPSGILHGVTPAVDGGGSMHA
jgi:hypothetical protein